MKDKQPLVAVWTMTYNHGPYLRDCLNGIVSQKTEFPFVAIVHDDCSTDDTISILKEYAEKYPDIIKPIFEEENQHSKHDGSLDRIKKHALETSGAKYIAMCEGDDYWIDPLKLQKQVDFLESNPDYTLCYTDLDFFYQKSQTIVKDVFSTRHIPRYKNFEEFLYNQGTLAPCSWLCRYETFVPELKSSADTTFDIALHNFTTGKIGYIPVGTCVYRVLEESASHSSSLHTAFRRQKSVYSIQKHYMEAYPHLMTNIQRHETKERVFRFLLPMAWYFNDDDLKEEIHEFYSNSLKHKIIIKTLYIYLFRNIFKGLLKLYWDIKYN